MTARRSGQTISNLLTVFLILLLLFAIFYKTGQPTPAPIIIKELAVDTILVRDTIVVRAPAKIVYKEKIIPITKDKDTTIVDTTSWSACIDTTIAKADVSVCYFYPENSFSIRVYPLPDTVRIYTKQVIEVPKIEKHKSDWKENALYVGGAFVGGLIIGLIVR